MNIYVDFDNTIVDTTAAITLWANNKFNTEFAASDVTQWDSKDLWPNIQRSDLDEIFNTAMWNNKLEVFDHCLTTLRKYKNLGHHIILVSIGSMSNIMYKMEYLIEGFGIIFDGWYLCGNKNLHIDKSFLKDKEGIIIDDHTNALNTADVQYKICAKMTKGDWNDQWQGLSGNNWEEIDTIIEQIIELHQTEIEAD